jgi:repressor LexA
MKRRTVPLFFFLTGERMFTYNIHAMKRDGRVKILAEKVNAFYIERRRMPSYSELLGVFGFRSKNAVYKALNKLAAGGFLERDGRGKLLPKSLSASLRLCGSVSAGFPSPAEEELQDTISLDEYLMSSPSATYLVKVDGDSMIDAGILPGDLILVQRGLTPKMGDIVIAQVDGEWTLKYFDKKGKVVLLRSGNKKYPPMTPKRELVIGGVVIANVRKYR